MKQIALRKQSSMELDLCQNMRYSDVFTYMQETSIICLMLIFYDCYNYSYHGKLFFILVIQLFSCLQFLHQYIKLSFYCKQIGFYNLTQPRVLISLTANSESMTHFKKKMLIVISRLPKTVLNLIFLLSFQALLVVSQSIYFFLSNRLKVLNFFFMHEEKRIFLPK